MKWLVFTGACVVALITLGILAVDERDVVWDGRQASCPYCRSHLADYSLACKECTRTLDWSAGQETCKWCLDRESATVLRETYEKVRARTEAHPPELSDYPASYFEEMDPGDCAYCAGAGSIGVGERKKDCLVCRGGADCVACDGSRYVVFGDVRAHHRLLRRQQAWVEAERRQELTGLAKDAEALLNEDVRALRGYAEAEQLEAGDSNKKLVARGFGRARRAIEIVQRVGRRLEESREDE